MSGNLDKILADIKKKTAKDIEKIDHEMKEKHDAVMNRRPYI